MRPAETTVFGFGSLSLSVISAPHWPQLEAHRQLEAVEYVRPRHDEDHRHANEPGSTAMSADGARAGRPYVLHVSFTIRPARPMHKPAQPYAASLSRPCAGVVVSKVHLDGCCFDDPVDAAVIADFARRMPFTPWKPPEKAFSELQGVARGEPKLVAIVAVMRKLSRAVYGMRRRERVRVILMGGKASGTNLLVSGVFHARDHSGAMYLCT